MVKAELIQSLLSGQSWHRASQTHLKAHPWEPRRLSKSSGLVPHLLYYQNKILGWPQVCPSISGSFYRKTQILASQLPTDVSASQTPLDQQNHQDKQKPFTLYVDSSRVVGKAPALFSSNHVQHPLMYKTSDLVTTESIARNKPVIS